MIVTVTANPSIDITLEVPDFAIGEVNRAVSIRKDPAGKGINVARALTRNGVVATAVFPADHNSGGWIVDALGQLGVPTVTVPIAGEVRQNTTVVDGNCTTKINQAGPTLSASEQDALVTRVRELLATKPEWLVVAGSLPGGLHTDFVVQLGTLAREAGVRYAVDASGDALVAVAEAGIANLLKPNLEELAELAERDLTTVGEVAAFCRTLPGGPIVLVSLGENGALLVSPTELLWAGHPPVIADSTVGAGDCTLAGFLAADVREPSNELAARLRTAVAWGTAAVQLPATSVPGPAQIQPEHVRLDPNPHETTRIQELRV